MEKDKNNHPFNFPYQYSSSVKNREIFADYGSSKIVNILKDGEIVSQKTKGDNYARFSAVHPVLPLSCTAEEVKLPLKDRVMGHVIENNKNLKDFCLRVQKFRSHGKRHGKTDQLENIFQGVEELTTRGEMLDYDTDTLENAFEESVGEHMKPWFRSMLKDYMQIQNSAGLQFKNNKYTGGCIDSIGVDDTHCYTVSAAGHKFNKLRLTCVSQKTDGLLQSYNAEEVKFSNTIYGIKSRRVQGEDFITVRTDNECYMYKFTHDSKERKLHMVDKQQPMCFQAVDISPYIAGECLLVDEAGKCYLWYGDNLDELDVQGKPRFQVSDNWRHIQYGSHPRQLVYADLTTVQIFDLRMPVVKGHDLFSLPSKLLHNSERIHACSRHPASTFYHVVATDYNLMLMDERHSKYPVLKWEHMLSTPPQYMDSVYGTSANPDDNFVYVASQYPPDVHAFRFSVRKGLPPLAVSQPHRAARITDISKWPQFADTCPNTAILHNRLDTSLAGMAIASWQQGHVVFQLDSHGEIFHQAFSAVQSSPDTTFSAGLGSHDLQALPVAVERARIWMESWVDMMKDLLAPQIKTRDVQANLLGLYHYRDPNKLCCICQPDLGYVPGGHEVTDKTAYCETCMVLLKDGQNLIDSIRKDKVMPCSAEHQPQGLKEVKDMPTGTALSKILTKQWYGEKDNQSFDDILKDWDKEVLEKRSSKKKRSSQDVPDMSEESVMKRLVQASKHAGSSPTHTVTSAGTESREPSIASSTDDLDGVSNGEKQRHRFEKLHTGGTSVQGSDRSGPSSKKRHKKAHNKVSRSVEGDWSSVQASTDNDSVKSFVLGSTDSAMSETFKITSPSKNSTILPMFGSQLARSKEHSLSSPSKSKNLDKTRECDENVPVFLSPMASQKTRILKTPGSERKSRHKRGAKSTSTTKSARSIDTVSEISVNTGSEDLFDGESHTGTVEFSVEDDKLSSVLSVASCDGMFNSQMSNNVSRNLFSSQKSADKTLDKMVSSPRKGGVSISPRKPAKRKPVAGF